MEIKDLLLLINSEAFLGYIESSEEENVQSFALAEFFPIRVTPGLDYSYVKSRNGVVELTAPSSYDSEAITQQREGFDAKAGELPLFRKKMKLSEKQKTSLVSLYNSGRNAELESFIKMLFDDNATLVTGALTTIEFMRSKALTDGYINLVSKGGQVKVDYGVPANHKEVLTGDSVWSNPASKILDDIIDWCDIIETDEGVRPNKAVINLATYKLFANNEQVRANLLPVSMLGQTIATAVPLDKRQILESIENFTGISFIVYNKKVAMDGATLDMVDDFKISLFSTDSKIGTSLIGTSPAEFDSTMIDKAGGSVSVTGDGIAVNVYSNGKSPYFVTTEVEFVGLPTLEGSDFIFLATVN